MPQEIVYISHQKATALCKKFFNGCKLPAGMDEYMFPCGSKLRFTNYKLDKDANMATGKFYYLRAYGYPSEQHLQQLLDA